MNDEEAREVYRRWALEVLELLGATPAEQLNHVRQLDVPVDEIALQFDDVFNFSYSRLEDGSLDEEGFRWLGMINEELQSMTDGTSDLWNDEAVISSVPWANLRILAKRVAVNLSESWADSL